MSTELPDSPPIPSEEAQKVIRDHLAKGGTVMCNLMLPIGAKLLILNKGELVAQEIAIGAIEPLDVSDLFVQMREVLNGPS